VPSNREALAGSRQSDYRGKIKALPMPVVRTGASSQRSPLQKMSSSVERSMLDWLSWNPGSHSGNILRGGAHGFVAYIDAVHFNASGAPEAASE